MIRVERFGMNELEASGLHMTLTVTNRAIHVCAYDMIGPLPAAFKMYANACTLFTSFVRVCRLDVSYLPIHIRFTISYHKFYNISTLEQAYVHVPCTSRRRWSEHI